MNSDLQQDTCGSLSELVDQYNSTLSRLLDEHAPLKTKTLIIRPGAPWLDKPILDVRKVRRQLERQWRSTRLTVDYERFKETVKQMIIAAKSLFNTTQINEHSTDLKTLFRVTSSIMGTKQATALPDHETLNKFFVQKIEMIRQNMDQEDSASPAAVADPISSVTVPAFSSFTPATMEEVEKLIRQSPTKSCGLDPVPTCLLKQHIDAWYQHVISHHQHCEHAVDRWSVSRPVQDSSRLPSDQKGHSGLQHSKELQTSVESLVHFKDSGKDRRCSSSEASPRQPSL